MTPSEKEALAAAKFLKLAQRQGRLGVTLTLLTGIPICYYLPPAAIVVLVVLVVVIQIHGRNCCVCGFNFNDAFGEDLAQGYIEIHHLNSIAAGVRNTDPATDLAPLCSNCHAMADRLTRQSASPPRSIEELKKLLSP